MLPQIKLVSAPKKIVLFLALLICVFYPYASNDYSVDASTLNIRSESNRRAAVVGKLKKGDVVVVDSLSGDKQWGHISSPKNGWISMDYLKKAELKAVASQNKNQKVNIVKWLSIQNYVKTFYNILQFLALIEVIILFVLSIKRLRFLDYHFRFLIPVGIMASGIYDEPLLIYLLPSCIAILIFYIILYGKKRASDVDTMSKIIFTCIFIFLIFFFFITRSVNLSFGGFILRAILVILVNFGFFMLLYSGVSDHECPHCNYFARHDTIDEAVTDVYYTTHESDGTDTVGHIYVDGSYVTDIKQKYKETEKYRNEVRAIQKQCWKCGGLFSYTKFSSDNVQSSKKYTGKKFID